MSERGPPSLGLAGVAAAPALALVARVATQTDLELTNPLLWVLLALSVAGALITYAFLVYAVWKFRDPKMKGRRYG